VVTQSLHGAVEYIEISTSPNPSLSLVVMVVAGTRPVVTLAEHALTLAAAPHSGAGCHGLLHRRLFLGPLLDRSSPSRRR